MLPSRQLERNSSEMDQQIDLRVAELMASRLCHDLVGPIGAVNNGMELLEDPELEMAQEAVRLAGHSAEHASILLQFFRLAYGMAGSRQGRDLGPMRELAKGFLSHAKSELEWPSDPLPDSAPEDLGKLLLNMIALAVEALPRGGTVAVSVAEGPGGLEVAARAAGSDVGLREEMAATLNGGVSVEELTPRNVQGYFTQLLARRLGSDLAVETEAGEAVKLRVALPHAA